MSTVQEYQPIVGDGATYRIGSDCYPYTIVEVVSPRKVMVQRDEYRRTDKNGISEAQTYSFFDLHSFISHMPHDDQLRTINYQEKDKSVSAEKI